MVVFPSLADPLLPGLLQAGSVGVLPTDTIYGLVASAHLPQAVKRLYELKDREQKPGTVIAASAQQLIQLGLDAAMIQHIAHLWPNPLSIELPIGPHLAHIHQGTGHGAFRVVSDPAVAALLKQTGPLLTSSANHPGKPPATTVHEAQAYFDTKVDFYVYGGNRGNNAPSTVIRLRPDGKFEMVREGAAVIVIDQNGSII